MDNYNVCKLIVNCMLSGMDYGIIMFLAAKAGNRILIQWLYVPKSEMTAKMIS